jgi:hypothetical protein
MSGGGKAFQPRIIPPIILICPTWSIFLGEHTHALSIDRNNLVWKRGNTIIPYVYDEEPNE